MGVFIKKHRWFVSLAVLSAVITGSIFLMRGDDQQFDYITVKKRDLIQEISVTGRVRPSKSVNLAFEKSGRIAGVFTSVGAPVLAGKLLVRLENEDLQAQLAQAQATLKQEQAKLDELRRGTRAEELDIQQAKVNDAKSALVEAIRDAFTKADDAVRNRVDQFISNPRSGFPNINFKYADSALSDQEDSAEKQRVVIEQKLNTWKIRVDALAVTDDLHAESAQTLSDLTLTKQFLDTAALLVNGALASGDFTQAKLDNYRADVVTARTNVNAALTSITGKQSNLIIQEQELNLDLAGTAVEILQAQEAKAEQAQANIDNIQALITKTIIRAPIKGTVTSLNAKVGEIAATNASVVSIISADKLEIEVNIPEADIAKLQLGNIARITLDAYSSDVIFEASVTRIDPAETIIEGVAVYSTTLQFTDFDERIRSGMTANVDILTGRKEDVIAVPQRAIFISGNEKFVRVFTKEQDIAEVAVTIGLRGSDGSVEITNGLQEGDRVITFVR